MTYCRANNVLFCFGGVEVNGFVHISGVKLKCSVRSNVYRNQFNKLWGGWVDKSLIERFYVKIPRKKKKLLYK